VLETVQLGSGGDTANTEDLDEDSDTHSDNDSDTSAPNVSSLQHDEVTMFLVDPDIDMTAQALQELISVEPMVCEAPAVPSISAKELPA
jgi:hypothetical protein